MAWPKGKPRPAGAGKKKGYKYPVTLQKERIRERFLARIEAELDELMAVQIRLAKEGDARMLISLMDRLIDKPTEHHEISVPLVPLFALPPGSMPSVANPRLLQPAPDVEAKPTTDHDHEEHEEDEDDE